MITSQQEVEEFIKRIGEAQLDELQHKFDELYKLLREYRRVKKA